VGGVGTGTWIESGIKKQRLWPVPGNEWLIVEEMRGKKELLFRLWNSKSIVKA
jgi:hypothetical protein